jgi:hypothetical protein
MAKAPLRETKTHPPIVESALVREKRRVAQAYVLLIDQRGPIIPTIEKFGCGRALSFDLKNNGRIQLAHIGAVYTHI